MQGEIKTASQSWQTGNIAKIMLPCAVKDAHLFLDSASFVNDFLAYPKRVHLFIYLCVMYTVNSVPRQKYDIWMTNYRVDATSCSL